MVGLEDESNFC